MPLGSNRRHPSCLHTHTHTHTHLQPLLMIWDLEELSFSTGFMCQNERVFVFHRRRLLGNWSREMRGEDFRGFQANLLNFKLYCLLNVSCSLQKKKSCMKNGGYWRKALNFEARPRFFPLLSNSCVGKAFLNSWPIYLWFLRVFFSNSKFENGLCLVLSESVFLATWREWLTQCSSILIFPRHLVVCSTELSSYRFSLSLSLSLSPSLSLLLGLQPKHMEVPRLRVESLELQMLAHATGTAKQCWI